MQHTGRAVVFEDSDDFHRRTLLVQGIADPDVLKESDDLFLLTATALVLMGWAWVRIETTPGADGARWSAPAHAMRAWVWPELEMRLSMLERQARESPVVEAVTA